MGGVWCLASALGPKITSMLSRGAVGTFRTLNSLNARRYQHLGDMMSLGAVNGAVTLPLPLPPPLAGALRGGILGSLAGAAGVKVDSADDSRRITLDGGPSGCRHSWRCFATLAGYTAIDVWHSTASTPATRRCRLQLHNNRSSAPSAATLPHGKANAPLDRSLRSWLVSVQGRWRAPCGGRRTGTGSRPASSGCGWAPPGWSSWGRTASRRSRWNLVAQPCLECSARHSGRRPAPGMVERFQLPTSRLCSRSYGDRLYPPCMAVALTERR